MQPESALDSDYPTLVRLLREFTDKAAVATRSERDDHYLRLWYRLLGLADTLALLTQNRDASGAQIILRTQLEIFARLQFFRARPDESWLSERATALREAHRVQSHHDNYPNLPYSKDVKQHIAALRDKWPDVTFSRKQSGVEVVGGAKSIRDIFEIVGKANLTDMSAYGFYQFLCEETHAGMLRVAARHTNSGQPDAVNSKLADESAAALITSAWMLRALAEPYLKSLSNEANNAHVAEIDRVFAVIEADR